MHLFFDLDGTLTDSREGILRCFQHALSELGVDVPSDSTLERYIGSPLSIDGCFAELLNTRDRAVIKRAVGAYRSRFEPIGMFENALYPGVGDALALLKAAADTLYVVTAKPAVYARRILRHFDIDTYFVSLHAPDLGESEFTKGFLVRQALEHNNVMSAEAMVIGDRAADVQAAKENGIRAIGVTWGYGERKELAGADHVVDSWPELVSWLLHAA